MYMENALKVSKRIWRIREKTLMANSGLCAANKIVSKYVDSVYTYLENTWTESMLDLFS